jgi:enoyl-[acyl-carrier-protein] reductase (NADH)
MKDGGTMFAMSYYGANKVVSNYNVMGPVKAALEASARYLAYELGPQGIRVHPVSPGPLKTRAASGLKDFDLLLNEAAQACTARRTGRHHGCRLHLRVPGHALCEDGSRAKPSTWMAACTSWREGP